VWLWDGSILHCEGGPYTDVCHSNYTINATADQIKAAGDYYQQIFKDACNKNGTTLYLGCVVELSRSRKAPNKTPLLVLNHKDRKWNDYYRTFDPEMILVEIDEQRAEWVSVGCVKNIVQYRRPWWSK
jgi:hypothetical protein